MAAGFKTKTEAWKFQREREAEAVGLPKFRRWWITYKGERLMLDLRLSGRYDNQPQRLSRGFGPGGGGAARKAEKHARRSGRREEGGRYASGAREAARQEDSHEDRGRGSDRAERAGFRESGQSVEWIFCLTAARFLVSNHEQS